MPGNVTHLLYFFKFMESNFIKELKLLCLMFNDNILSQTCKQKCMFRKIKFLVKMETFINIHSD